MRCPACREEEETVEHFLLSCLNYVHKRWALDQQARKLYKQMMLGTLLGEADMIAPLANYIHAMQWFINKGEQVTYMRQHAI